MKQFLINTFLILASIVCILAVLELFFRFTSSNFYVSFQDGLEGHYQFDANAGFDIKPNLATTTHKFPEMHYEVWSNELGCFDMPYSGETPYIYLAGDSFTWGSTPFEDKWGTLLQESTGTRVLKCGVNGYGTRQQYEKAKKILASLPPPELIIVGYFIGNDWFDDATFPNSVATDGLLLTNADGAIDPAKALEQKQNIDTYCMKEAPANPLLQRTKCLLKKHSRLYYVLSGTLRNALSAIVPKDALEGVGVINTPEREPYINDETYAEHLENIKKFKILAEEKGSKLLFVLIPPEAEVYDFLRPDPLPPELARKPQLLAFLEAEAISYVDLAPLMQERTDTSVKTLYWPNDVHLNIEGNHLVGRIVAEYLDNL